MTMKAHARQIFALVALILSAIFGQAAQAAKGSIVPLQTVPSTAEVVKVSAVIESLGALAKEGAASVYVEILSKHGVRVIRPENDPVIIERVSE
jgi:ribosomal protein L2